ncbi:hypothetical protein CNR22_05165 [Sphingobacteriaceae bacterium]|nr:hypothetical protein CNR22_05165 [Sphingobacteriaceae bacterium]
MQLKFTILFTLWLGVITAQSPFTRSTFYHAFMGNKIEGIDKELEALNAVSGNEAFKGAMLMKKSGLVSQTKEKLKLFKEGHKALELTIHNDSTNAEYRFLRLAIQENAPKIVNYNKEIKADAAYLRRNYQGLSQGLQRVVINYSKTSKELKPEDFKH